MLLNNQRVNQQIKEETKKKKKTQNMETHENENTMVQNLWYAAKVVLRRKFIFFKFIYLF